MGNWKGVSSVFAGLGSVAALFGGYKLYNYFFGSSADSKPAASESEEESTPRSAKTSRSTTGKPVKKEERNLNSTFLVIGFVVLAVTLYCCFVSQSEEHRESVHPLDHMV